MVAATPHSAAKLNFAIHLLGLILALCLIATESSAQVPLLLIRSSPTPLVAGRDTQALKHFQEIGIIETRHDPVGLKYVFKVGRNVFDLRYVWELEADQLTKLQSLTESHRAVAVVGVMKVRLGKPVEFDSQTNISVYDAAEYKLAKHSTIAPADSLLDTKRHMNCTGPVTYGSLDSEVGECSFISGSKVGSLLLKVCPVGRFCKVEAVVVGEHNMIERVIRVVRQ